MFFLSILFERLSFFKIEVAEMLDDKNVSATF